MRIRNLALTACLAAAALLAVVPRPAFAQAGAYCSVASEKPVAISPTNSPPTYTLSASDQCSFMVFTNTTAMHLVMPNAAVAVPAGFKVWIRAQGSGGVTIDTPTTSTIDGSASLVSVPQHSGLTLRSDAVNYFTGGASVSH